MTLREKLIMARERHGRPFITELPSPRVQDKSVRLREIEAFPKSQPIDQHFTKYFYDEVSRAPT